MRSIFLGVHFVIKVGKIMNISDQCRWIDLKLSLTQLGCYCSLKYDIYDIFLFWSFTSLISAWLFVIYDFDEYGDLVITKLWFLCGCWSFTFYLGHLANDFTSKNVFSKGNLPALILIFMYKNLVLNMLNMLCFELSLNYITIHLSIG